MATKVGAEATVAGWCPQPGQQQRGGHAELSGREQRLRAGGRRAFLPGEGHRAAAGAGKGQRQRCGPLLWGWGGGASWVSCAGHLIPMNLQLNAEVGDKRVVKGDIVPSSGEEAGSLGKGQPPT